MQNHFQVGYNPQGSLKIYQPPAPLISNTFFASEYHPNLNGSDSRHKTYVRHESLIDQLNNKQEDNQQQPSGSTSLLEPRPTSIQFLVDRNQSKQPFPKKQMLKIGDIFANRPDFSSKEFNSSVLNSLNGPLFQKTAKADSKLNESIRHSSSHIVLPQFPSKQYVTDSPERPNLNRPFLRKKASSIRNSEVAEPSTQNHNKKDEQSHSFQINKLQSAINHLKEYNNGLLSVFNTLQVLEEDQGNTEWKSLKGSQINLLKLMVEKAIISKQDH